MSRARPRYDVFLSYRREGADGTARLFYERLLRDGYRAAFDLETLRSGDFDEQILNTIRTCRDMVVFLSPGALDRCIHKGDWVRREIACALESGINVVPVLLRGFAFPPAEELPSDIRGLVRKQGVGAAMEHLDSTVDKLERLLASRPVARLRRHALAWTANLAVALLLLGGAFLVLRRPAPAVPDNAAPASAEERRAASKTSPDEPAAPAPAAPVWSPGALHPVCPNVRASLIEGQWEPMPGFRFSNADSNSLTVFRTTTRMESPSLIDLSGLTTEAKKTIVTNLFFSSHADGAHGDWEETDGEFQVLADAFEDGFISTVIKLPEGEWRNTLQKGGTQRQYVAIAQAMIEARADDCRNLEETLNELGSLLPDDYVLTRGTLRKVWRELPRWPARKPDMPPRPHVPNRPALPSHGSPQVPPTLPAGATSPEAGPPPSAPPTAPKHAAKAQQLDAAKQTR